MDAQRALLDELMGAARNLTDEERRGFKEVKWDDREVNDLDRKVRRGGERLAQEVEPPPPPSLSEQLSVLEENVKNLLEQVEALGEEGKVDEAEALMRKEALEAAQKRWTTRNFDVGKPLGRGKFGHVCCSIKF